MKKIEAIDVHSHYNHGQVIETVETPIYNPNLDYLKQKMDSTNISKMFCSTFSSVLTPKYVEEENEYNFELSHKNDWLYQWVVIDPKNENTFNQAKTMLLDKKCVGIKVHPYCHEFSWEDYGDKLCSFASEYETVIQTHPEEGEKIPSVLPFGDKYEKVNIILAHLGSVHHVDAIAYAKNKNIYTDTSGNASSNNYVIEYAVKRVGADRILFGTDTYDTGFQRGRIEYALISDEDKKKILRYNAEKLFKKNLK